MKVLKLLIRVGVSLFIAFPISFSSAVIYFDYTEYENAIDRFMLVTIPTLAIGFLLFQSAPKIWNWLRQRKLSYLILFAIFAIIAALVTVLSVGTSRVYLMGTFSYAIVLLALMLPALPALEKLSPKYSILHYLFGFLLSFSLLYILIGFIIGTLDGNFHLMALTTFWMTLCSVVGYYFFRHVTWSRKHGFLKNWLNCFLVLILPVFVYIIFYIHAQFPTMFNTEYFHIPSNLFDVYLSSAVLGGAWGILLLEQIERRNIYQTFRNTKLFSFIKENLFGFYVSGAVFLINLIIARTLNLPSYSLNSIIFEADAGPWLAILGLPEGYNVNRAVHPLTLITIRPFVRFIGQFLADKWFLAPMIGVAFTSASAVFMAWIFIRRASQNNTYAFIFSTLLGISASHLIFGSLAETYVFGMASLVFFLLLVQADEKRFSVLIPTGLLVFGITVTNIAQSMIALLFKKFGFWRLVYYGVLVLTMGIALTAFVNVLFPGNQSSFWVPEDILFEAQFSKPVYEEEQESLTARAQIVTRTMFLYSVLAPTPIPTVRDKDTQGEIVNFKTYHPKDKIPAWYDGFANIPLVMWLVLLFASMILFIKNRLVSEDASMLLGILGGLAFNFLLHMNYGTELFLYTPNFTFLVVFFIALSLKPLAGKRWFEIGLTFLLLLVFINNAKFIFAILSGLSPYVGRN
jgi:hypothetical protein